MENGNADAAEDRTLQTIAIITGTVCILFIILSLSLSLSWFYCYCCRDRGRGRRRTHSDEECGESPSPVSSLGPVAFQPQGISIQQLSESSLHPLPSLQQNHIVQRTTLEKSLEKGQFCETYIGVWRKDRVLVKVFPEKSEKFWFTESTIHQLPHMHHESIHCFYATTTPESSEHRMVLEYYRLGCLHHYLQSSVLHVAHLLSFAMSVAEGMAFLHSEISDTHGKKPAIVHRNLSSKALYVKTNGTCCISDFSLAVAGSADVGSEVKSRAQRHFRYMAPEFLANPAAQNSFENLKKADMYSYGLVLWEIARRCSIHGVVEEACLPYSGHTHSSSPSSEEMRELVVTRNLRPPIPEHWNRNEDMRIIVRIITECWHGNSSVRLSSLRVKKTLWKHSDRQSP